MMIEIRGAGFVNKGAELMLCAIRQRVSEELPDANFVMEPRSRTASYLERARMGFYQKLPYSSDKKGVSKLSKISKESRLMYGLVLDSEIDVVLDASGFAYSDQMGDTKSVRLAKFIKQWKRQGTKVVLLPQAFGPFSTSPIKNAIKVIADYADLIFTRDKVSYNYLTGVVGERNNIKMSTDFTNLVEGVFPERYSRIQNRFCFVLNNQMIKKTTPEISAAYVPFLISCLRILKSKGENPFILVHCKEDTELAALVASRLNEKVEIVIESDPLVIKGILGACGGAISSRFHGLVSALSQGVPSLAAGWSHKYHMLFEDYGFEEGLIDPTASEDEIRTKIDTVTDPDLSLKIRSRINENSERLKQCSEAMWKDIFYLINS